jgi:hypothetical protein
MCPKLSSINNLGQRFFKDHLYLNRTEKHTKIKIMKIIFSIIFLVLFASKIKAQNIELSFLKMLEQKEVMRGIEWDKNINLFNSFDFLMMPQLGGLFNESFKYVEGISNLKNHYDDFDIGFKLGIKYNLMDNMTFTSVYNLGILKFNLAETSNIEGAVMKMALCYNF